MHKYDLSILIPARNEMFLAKTIEELQKNIRGNTEIIVALDGQWADSEIMDAPNLTLLYFPHSIGQRAATNQACRLSKAKYVMKLDAHCAVSEGFDVTLMNDMQEDITMVPIMRNLHVFDWVCSKGHRRYQGQSGVCKECGQSTTRDIVWHAKESPRSTSFYFDRDMHFQYFNQYKKVQEATGNHLVETMSLQGSCFMLTRKKYWELNICDEKHGSWGQQGVEVACKTWLSGGRVLCNKNAWYAHMFRTQGGDFQFPYPLSGRDQEKTRIYSRNLWLNDKWPLAIHKLQWLIDKFAPVPGWDGSSAATATELPFQSGKGIIYYTDNQLNLKIAHAVQKQLRSIGIPITSASLKPMTNMGKNVHLPLARGYETYFKQIIAALEASTAEIVFFCEHDNLMHRSHFEFTPPDKNKFYYDHNWWKIRKDGLAVHWDANQVSGLCCYREHALEWYRNRLKTYYEQIKTFGKFDRKFEPNDNDTSENWKAPFPSIDIRHDHNLTYNKWKLEHFRDKTTAKNFEESSIDKIQGWDTDLLKSLY